MNGPDRRLTPRTTAEKHAYIDIAPNNGAIVLNVSAGGLCFHSSEPVRRGTTTFWFGGRKLGIEADGEVVWTDETHKGGLRFNALPTEAREIIRTWMGEPGNHPAVRPEPNRILPRTRPLNGFAGGLAVGLVITSVVAAAFLFHIYRDQVGESLIHLGERFLSKSQVQAQSAAPAGEAAVPPVTALSAQPTAAPARPAAAPAGRHSQELLSQPESDPAQPPAYKVSTAPSQQETNAPQPSPSASSPALTAEAEPVPMPALPEASLAKSLPPPVVTLPTIAAPDLRAAPMTTVGVPQFPAAADVQAESSTTSNAESISEMFFEVGRFKDKKQAATTTDKLAQLGFPTNAVQKSHLWASSYHVLVGPYGNTDAATATHKSLVSYGFKPRPFERGSRDLNLRSPLKLNGTAIPVGECTVNWESYVSDATVRFVRENSVITTAQGRWVSRDTRNDTDAYVYRRNPDGSKTLLEIRFAGMRQVLDLTEGPHLR